MRTIYFISFLFVSLVAKPASGIDTLIVCHYQDAAFPVFCSDIQKQTGISVFYRESDAGNLKVTLNADHINVREAMKTVLTGTGLAVSEWNGNLVVLKGEPLLSNLPEFKNPIVQVNTEVIPNGLTESEERYLKGRKARQAEVIRIGKNTFGNNPARVKILGKITEQETGEPVIGAALLIDELATGALTDQNGYLTMAIKPGTYSVRFEFLGYEKKEG